MSVYIGIQQQLSQYIVHWQTVLDGRYARTAAITAVNNREADIDQAAVQANADTNLVVRLENETAHISTQV